MKEWLLANWSGLPLLVKIAVVLLAALMLTTVSVWFAHWLNDSAEMFEIRLHINEQMCQDPTDTGANCLP